MANKDNTDGVFIDNILDHALKDDSFEIDGEHISFYSCLEIFVRKTLSLIGIVRSTTEERRKICFTVRSLDEAMVKLLERIASSIGQSKDKIIFQSHKDINLFLPFCPSYTNLNPTRVGFKSSVFVWRFIYYRYYLHRR